MKLKILLKLMQYLATSAGSCQLEHLFSRSKVSYFESVPVLDFFYLLSIIYICVYLYVQRVPGRLNDGKALRTASMSELARSTSGDNSGSTPSKIS